MLTPQDQKWFNFSIVAPNTYDCMTCNPASCVGPGIHLCSLLISISVNTKKDNFSFRVIHKLWMRRDYLLKSSQCPITLFVNAKFQNYWIKVPHGSIMLSPGWTQTRYHSMLQQCYLPCISYLPYSILFVIYISSLPIGLKWLVCMDTSKCYKQLTWVAGVPCQTKTINFIE